MRGSSRVCLARVLKREAIPEQVINWYWEQPDMSIPNFDRYVLLLDLDLSETEQQRVRDTCAPMQDTIVIYYRYIEPYHELRLYCDSLAVAMPYPEADRLEAETQMPDNSLFCLTHVTRFDAMHWLTQYRYEDVSLYDLLERALPSKVQSYLRHENTKAMSGNAPRLECAASVLAALVGHVLECLHPPTGNAYDGQAIWAHFHGKRFRTQYEKARKQQECDTLLPQRLARFSTETLLVKLLRWNDLQHWMREHVEDPTQADCRAYRVLFPEATYFPTIWFSISCWEVPAATLDSYPVYAGGVIHLPCYWRAMAQWLQHRWVVQRDAEYAKWKAELAIPQLPDHIWEAVKAQAQLVYRHYYDAVYAPKPPVLDREERKRRIAQQRTQRQHIGNGNGNAVQAFAADIEDLCKLLPPCVLAVHEAGQFPANDVRNKAVLVMFDGGVDNASIYNFFAALHERYPRANDPNGTMERRPFDLVGLLNWAATREGKKVVCRSIVSDTLRRKDQTLQCPYALLPEMDPVKHDLEQTTSACGAYCNKGRGKFGGMPHVLVQQARRRQVQAALDLKRELEAAKAHSGPPDSSESVSSEGGADE